MCSVSSEGEHPVSAKFRGLRNRFVKWWVLGAPHEQPIFTSVFEKNVISSGANRVSAAFQFQLRSSSLMVFWSQNIRIPQSQTFGQPFFLWFSCVSAGKNGVLTLCSSHSNQGSSSSLPESSSGGAHLPKARFHFGQAATREGEATCLIVHHCAQALH